MKEKHVVSCEDAHLIESAAWWWIKTKFLDGEHIEGYAEVDNKMLYTCNS